MKVTVTVELPMMETRTGTGDLVEAATRTVSESLEVVETWRPAFKDAVKECAMRIELSIYGEPLGCASGQ
jgi:hypothetical protein